jgi:hypothetical protein
MCDSGPERPCRCRGPAARAGRMRHLRGVRELTGALSRAPGWWVKSQLSRSDVTYRPLALCRIGCGPARSVECPVERIRRSTFGPTGEREGTAPAALMAAPARRMRGRFVEQCAVSWHRHLRRETRSEARPREGSSPEALSTKIARGGGGRGRPGCARLARLRRCDPAVLAVS